MIDSLLIGRLNAICPSRRVNARRSLAVVIFVCVELLSSFGADPKSSTENESEYTNHLINEKSPYLLQHAHNPVDWYPWGEEPFAADFTRPRIGTAWQSRPSMPSRFNCRDH